MKRESSLLATCLSCGPMPLTHEADYSETCNYFLYFVLRYGWDCRFNNGYGCINLTMGV